MDSAGRGEASRHCTVSDRARAGVDSTAEKVGLCGDCSDGQVRGYALPWAEGRDVS